MDKFVNNPSSTKNIIDCLSVYYGLEIVTVKNLNLGADMNALVYKAQAGGGDSYFVKLKSDNHNDINLTLLTLLHESRIQKVIPPLKTIHNKLSESIDNFTLIVYPFVEGKDGFTTSLTNDQWVMLGQFRQIHEINLPPTIQEGIKKEAYSSKWRKAVRSFYEYIEADVRGDKIALTLINFMKEHRELILHLVNRSENLSHKVQEYSPNFVLCHSDIHGGNVLINTEGAIYVVDWDEPIMAPKERDLMFIGGGVANIWNKPHEEFFFYKGYGQTEINREILAYYRYERIIEDIAVYAKAFLSDKIPSKDKSEMYGHFIGMFQPCGVVDIAFKTDEMNNSYFLF